MTTPSTVVDYAYDLAGNVVSRTEGGDTVELVYDSLTGLPRAVSGSDGSWWLYVDGVPLAQHTSTGATAYLHTDTRGDVRLATDTTGAVTDTWTYSVDGELTARTGTTPVTVGWRGETHDTATGLIWLRARWYDPATARFLSADPWHGDPSNPVSLNRYLYGNADPVNMHDPTGQYATSLGELNATQRAAAPLYTIRGMSVSRANFYIQLALNTVAAVGVTTLVALDALGDDPNDDKGLDGGPEPEPKPQPQPSPPGPRTDLRQCDDPNDPDCTDRVVIGESSRRTAGAALALDAEYWPGIGDNASQLEVCTANLAWIESVMDRGATIFDIGIDVNRHGSRSPYYDLETRAVTRRGYPVVPTPWPSSPDSYHVDPEPACPM